MTLHAHSRRKGGTLAALNVWREAGPWKGQDGEGGKLATRLLSPVRAGLAGLVAMQNKRAHFLAFMRAAHGKVRHSVKWKTGRGVRRHRKINICRLIYLLQRREHDSFLMQKVVKNFYWSKDFEGTLCEPIEPHVIPEPINPFPFHFKNPRKNRSELLDQLVDSFAKRQFHETDDAASEDYAFFAAYDIFSDEIKHTKIQGFSRVKYLQSQPLNSKAESRLNNRYHTVAYQRDFLRYALIKGDKLAVRLLINLHKAVRCSISLVLRGLEREAYRAHLTQRVKPVSRRQRVPRPLYARPRPPTCPLAPPVI